GQRLIQDATQRLAERVDAGEVALIGGPRREHHVHCGDGGAQSEWMALGHKRSEAAEQRGTRARRRFGGRGHCGNSTLRQKTTSPSWKSGVKCCCRYCHTSGARTALGTPSTSGESAEGGTSAARMFGFCSIRAMTSRWRSSDS